MVENEKIYTVKHLFLGMIIMFIIGLGVGLVSDSAEIDIYKTILRAESGWAETSLDSQQADFYYDLAGYAYEDQEYKEVERNCKLAREYFLRESQGYKKIKAEVESSEVEDKLIDIYISTLDSSIKMANSMFEACEYFESASRYYDKYYSDSIWDDRDYEMGSAELDSMNEKIEAHDEAVEEYNQYLEDFKVELEKRI